MQQQSACLAPPPELRNHVYELIMLQDEDIDVRGAMRGNPARPPALLQACQQLRREATPMYYGRNTFAIEPRERRYQYVDEDDALCTWLSALDAYARSCLRTIRLPKGHHSGSSKRAERRLLACRRKLSEGQVEIDGAKLLVEYRDMDIRAMWKLHLWKVKSG